MREVTKQALNAIVFCKQKKFKKNKSKSEWGIVSVYVECMQQKILKKTS